MSFRVNKSDAVRQAAKGRWLEIFQALCSDLKDATKNVGDHVPCPVSGGTDGFRLYSDAKDTGGGVSNQHGSFPNGFDLLMWVWDTDFKDVLARVSNYLEMDDWNKGNTAPVAAVRSANYVDVKKVEEKDLQKYRLSNRRTWMQSFTLTDPRAQLARTYLANRGLDIGKLNLAGLSKTMRFHPNLGLWQNGVKIGNFPAIISLFSYDDGTPACLHRTYLDRNGNKLNLEFDGKTINAKKLTKACLDKRLTGGAIRLGQPSEELHVAEGIETALSVMQAKRVPVWPCANSTLLGLLEPPKGVKRIYDWADKDREKNGKIAGTDAAWSLYERMAERGIEVITLFPHDPIPEQSNSVDWNDVLVRHGESGFPDDLNNYM
jgi:hypothetical protein